MTPSPADSSLEPTLESTVRIERRKRLRQFQTDLVDRMQAAREQTDVHDNQLGIAIGQTRWLLNLQEIGEIVPYATLTDVPLTKAWYLGLINIRGNLISVIDFASFQGIAPTPVDSTSRIVTFAPTLGINCGLLVSRVLGLRNVSQMGPGSNPDENTEAWAGQIYLDSDSLEWISLKLASIAQDPRFLQIGL